MYQKLLKSDHFKQVIQEKIGSHFWTTVHLKCW